MQEMDLIPSFNSAILPQSQGNALSPGQAQGVYFTMPAGVYKGLPAKVDGWFEGRGEVVLTDFGLTDKLELGYIMIEWQEEENDPLFLAILRDEELVEDYAVYVQEVE